MSMNENFLGNEPAGSRPFRNMLHPLHEAAMRLAGAKPGASRTRELVSMLLSHGARAWRGSQPQASIHLYMTSPNGRNPVRLRLR